MTIFLVVYHLVRLNVPCMFKKLFGSSSSKKKKRQESSPAPAPLTLKKPKLAPKTPDGAAQGEPSSAYLEKVSHSGRICFEFDFVSRRRASRLVRPVGRLSSESLPIGVISYARFVGRPHHSG